MIKYIKQFIVLISITSSCNDKIEIDKNIKYKGKLIYIEDIDGKDGLHMPDFGDIVVLDPSTGKKDYLTKDKYINYCQHLTV